MKVKLDENVTAAASALFMEAGHETHTVTDEGLNGVDDEQLFAVCVREDRLLITFDVGFGDVRASSAGNACRHHPDASARSATRGDARCASSRARRA